MRTFTITFGEQAENHPNMQKIGKMSQHGLSIDDLKTAKHQFEEMGCKCELVFLNEYLPNPCGNMVEQAAILIVKNGVNAILGNVILGDDKGNNGNNEGNGAKRLLNEHLGIEYDEKTYMYGNVVNARARKNVCFDDTSQEPDYWNKKGRIVSFSDVPLTRHIRQELPKFFGDKAKDLKAEGNYYYDISKCGIAYHTDGERNVVIGVRVGSKLPLHFHWFNDNDAIGKTAKFEISGGDIYAMSEVATGTAGKSGVHLRHAAGSKKYTTIKQVEDAKQMRLNFSN